MLSPTTSGMLMIRNGQSRSCAHTQRQRTNANIHLVLGDIDSRDNEIILCHHPAPFLARFGLQARATVRVEEDTGSVPRSPAGSCGLRARTGSDPATGGPWPPVRVFWHILPTQEPRLSRINHCAID